MMRPATPMARVRAALPALVALVAADQAVRHLPFAWIAKRVQRPLRAPRGASDDDARIVRWAIAAAAARIPWEVRCLAQAVAANELLARRQVASRLWLGVGRDERGRLDAHAWLESSGVIVTGRRGMGAFTPLHRLENGSVGGGEGPACSSAS